jgi:acyl carrier protein
MAMVAQLEDTFGIMLEMDDIIDFGSYTIGVDILKKYNVEISPAG